MKKVLILAYNFQPKNTISAHRPNSWFRYFHRNNLYPVVITKDWECNFDESLNHDENRIEKGTGGTIIRVPLKAALPNRNIAKRSILIRKALTLCTVIGQYFIKSLDEKYGLYKEAREFLKKEDCDIILATGNPFILFTYASRLGKEFHIPWVADYRDGWTTGNQLHFANWVTKLISKIVERPIERMVLKDAALITSASPTYSDEIKKEFPEYEFCNIFNGYEEKYFQNLEIFDKIGKDELIISHLGTIYPFHPIETFLEGLKKLNSDYPSIKVKVIFYGLQSQPDQKLRILNFDPELNYQFEFTPRLDQHEVIKRSNGSHIVLLLSNPGVVNLSAKVFDYLRLNKRILLVLDDKSILSQILDECSAGVKCNSHQDVTSALQAVWRDIEDGSIQQHKTINFNKYSREHQASLMAKETIKNM